MPGPSKPAAEPPRDLASPYHTALLIGLYVAVAALGLTLTSRGIAVQLPYVPVSRALVYAQLCVVAWAMLLYVCLIGRKQNALPQLLGKRWYSVRRAIADVALAAILWIFIKGCELLWLQLFSAHSSPNAVAGLLPQTATQLVGWIIVSLSVGVSEEVVFRGYLQTQLTAFSGRATIAAASRPPGPETRARDSPWWRRK